MGALLPPPLRAGSTVAIVAPAGPAPRQWLFTGMAWLAQRYRLRMRTTALTQEGYFAGSDARRAAELQWALTEPGIEAVLAARGGYGAMRLLEHIDVRAMATAAPRWVMGFSDITTLHVELAAAGIASIHSPNATGIGVMSVCERVDFLRALERPRAPHRWAELRVLVPGRATGPVFGGNLAIVEAMAAAGRLRMPEGALLFLEDVTERPYRIDRMLTSLALAGVLERAGAIVVGDFAQCDPLADGVTVEDVLDRRLGFLRCPVVTGAPFGHGTRNAPFIHGQNATVDGSTVQFGGS